MPQRLQDLQDQYEQLFRDCQIVDAGKQQEVDKASAAMLARRPDMPPRIGWASPGTSSPWCTSGRLREISARASATATACRPASVGRMTLWR